MYLVMNSTTSTGISLAVNVLDTLLQVYEPARSGRGNRHVIGSKERVCNNHAQPSSSLLRRHMKSG